MLNLKRNKHMNIIRDNKQTVNNKYFIVYVETGTPCTRHKQIKWLYD